MFMMVTADGYFEGVDHDLSWHNVDSEFNDFARQQLDEADTIVMGRKTYQIMADYWPTAAAKAADPGTARRMNALPKIVFSKYPLVTKWRHVRAHIDNVAKVLGELKASAGKDIAVLASSNLGLTLLEHGLIDEIRLMVNPIVIGHGTSLFAGLTKRPGLKLIATRQFNSGNVLLTYDVVSFPALET